MTKFVVTLIIVSVIAAAGLVATNESAYMDTNAGQDQKISSILK